MADYIDHLPLPKKFLADYEQNHDSHFPGGGKVNYGKLFRDTHEYLNKNVHGRVELRASLVEPGIFLTDHGPDHIRAVMARAQLLVATQTWATNPRRSEIPYESCLSPYEVFLLLMAIHFHDVGNTYGRDGHEKRICDMMKQVAVLGDFDRFELAAIARIATCHGGNFGGDLDTISKLPANERAGSQTYRPRLIAAVLRLADELAEDRSRADNFALKDPSNLPAASLIFHKYAAALNSVQLDAANHSIDLRFQLTKADANARHQFKGDQIFLVDYIYNRSLKTYRELVYCNRFTQDLECKFREVAIQIDAVCQEHDFAPTKTITYRIGEIGYPDDTHGTLGSLAPGFANALTGEQLAAFLAAKCGSDTKGAK